VVDVYLTPNFRMDGDKRRSLENLLNRITVQTAAFDYRLEVSEYGLDAALRMRDRDGREVSFEIVETTGRPRLGSLIAPDFALVRRRGARSRVVIDGQERTPEKMTRLVRGPASYFTRYSTRVVIANWNERRDALLEPLPLRAGAAEVTAGNLTYGLRWNGVLPEVESVIAPAGMDRVTFRFSPALPAWAALRPDAVVAGRFVINVNEVEGITAGEYRVQRDATGVRLEIQPLQAWQPPILRGPPWVASYRYIARLDLSSPQPRLKSEWRRAE
jgi:hypothetical protein